MAEKDAIVIEIYFTEENLEETIEGVWKVLYEHYCTTILCFFCINFCEKSIKKSIRKRKKSKYRYYMAFLENPLDEEGSYTVDKLIDLIKSLIYNKKRSQ